METQAQSEVLENGEKMKSLRVDDRRLRTRTMELAEPLKIVGGYITSAAGHQMGSSHLRFVGLVVKADGCLCMIKNFTSGRMVDDKGHQIWDYPMGTSYVRMHGRVKITPLPLVELELRKRGISPKESDEFVKSEYKYKYDRMTLGTQTHVEFVQTKWGNPKRTK